MMQADEIRKLEEALTDEERELLDKLATGIADRRLSPAALFFLESVKPLGFVGSQLLHFFRPIISTLWQSPVTYDQVASILERRGSIELLCRRLEARADRRDKADDESKEDGQSPDSGDS